MTTLKDYIRDALNNVYDSQESGDTKDVVVEQQLELVMDNIKDILERVLDV